MPCRSGTWHPKANSSMPSPFRSNSEFQEVKVKLDTVTDLLCDLCAELEIVADPISKSPEIITWWENHKEEDRLKKEKKENQFQEALIDAKLAQKKRTEYFQLMCNPKLDTMDKDYFSKRMNSMTDTITKHIENFPEIENYVSKSNPKKETGT